MTSTPISIGGDGIRILKKWSKPFSALDRTSVYESLLETLRPGETITKALHRLGGKPKSAAEQRKERWRQKKAQKSEEKEEILVEATPFLKLTGLVDTLVGDGEFEAYGFTYEKVSAFGRRGSRY